MRNLLRVCLLACAVLASSSGWALEPYSGPQEAATTNYFSGGLGAWGCPNMTPKATYSDLVACYTAAGLSSPTYGWSFSPSGTSISYATAPVGTTGSLQTVYQCGTVGNSSCTSSIIAYVTLGCGGATNRDLGDAGAGPQCVSKCFSLRNTEVSAFVPIDDPGQLVLGSCLFIAGKGNCQLENGDTSNYTYGTQLYRAGTWIHVGQRCTEDASDAPSIGAAGSAPTPGTGSGSSSQSGPGGGGLSATDSTNLANTATRTGQTTDAVTAMDSNLGGKLDALKGDTNTMKGDTTAIKNSLDDLKANRCGGPGQPNCKVEDVPTSATESAAASMEDNAKSGRESLKASDEALTSSIAYEALPQPGWTDRWIFNLSSFLGVVPAACDAFPSLTVMGQTYTVNVCPYLPYWLDFAAWLVFLYTAFGMWTTVYVREGGK